MHSARERSTGCLPGKEKATGAFGEPVVDLHAGPDDLVRVRAHGVWVGAPVAEDRFELKRTQRVLLVLLVLIRSFSIGIESLLWRTRRSREATSPAFGLVL